MSQASRNEESFTQHMMGLHDDLAQRFFAHQRSLLDRDFVNAASFLAGYRKRLLWHMQDEESLVLPRYQQAGGDETDAPVRCSSASTRRCATSSPTAS